MNAKTLRNLVIAAVVLTVLAVITTRNNDPEPANEEDRKLWADVAMNNAAEVKITSPDGTITIVKSNDGWVVQEKAGYPIQFKQLRDFLGSLYELKIGETVTTTAEQKKEMELLAPDAGKGAGTQVTLKSSSGQELLSFIAGKSFTPAGDNSNPMMMAGVISTALVTTMLGLCVAIPTVFIHSIMAGQSKKLVEILEEQATGLVAQSSEQQHKG